MANALTEKEIAEKKNNFNDAIFCVMVIYKISIEKCESKSFLARKKDVLTHLKMSIICNNN